MKRLIAAALSLLVLAALQDATSRSAAEPSVRWLTAPVGVPGSTVQPLTGTPHVAALDPRVGREGVITHMGRRRPWPVEYLAIPLGPGVRVRICGPAACRDMVSTDAGPNRERILAGVIADVSWQRFETLCGVPASFGVCPGSWMRVTGPRLTLPPTDSTSTEGGQP